MSEMSELRMEFLKETEEDRSIFSQVVFLGNKKFLEPRDVIDRGVSTLEVVPRFGLDPGFIVRLEKTLTEMQRVLSRASVLVPERRTVFTIDPHDALLPVLRGADTLDELQIAWTALSKRFALSMDYLDKYENEYKATVADERPSSPVSTDPGVYERYPTAKSTLSRLAYLYDNVPHLQALLPEDYDHDTSYLTDHLPASAKLRMAFPDQLGEERPSTVYYSSSGERMERSLSEWTSWRTGGNFDIPPEDLHSGPSDLFRRRVTINKTREERSPVEDWENDNEPDYDSPSTVQHWGLQPGPHTLLSGTTPFKDDDEPEPRRVQLPPEPKDLVGGQPHRKIVVRLHDRLQYVLSAAPAEEPQMAGEGMMGTTIRTMDVTRESPESRGRHVIGVTLTLMHFRRLALLALLLLQVPMEAEAEEEAEMEAVGEMGLPNYIHMSLLVLRWDGTHKTAVDYFWDIGQLASLEGWMPEALAYWLPSRLEKGSTVQMWFSTLSSARQKEMCSHYMTYLRVIKESFLGKRWQLEMNLEFENQSFRQEGHERESPQKFLGRRIHMVRMLANSDDGGPLEVFLVMRKAPIVWSTILVLENIHLSEELYSKVNDHQSALVAAVKKESGEVVTLNNLAASLRRLEFSQNPSSTARRANLTSADVESDVEGEKTLGTGSLTEILDPSDGSETIKQVYQILKKRQ
ncbi:hypothetical protein C8R44DRAFT_874266 [Mycena epipterygia]|nr:hypothetical protein C8R44DRAFT_874266 [Mycena epipterygia]